MFNYNVRVMGWLEDSPQPIEDVDKSRIYERSSGGVHIEKIHLVARGASNLDA
jgi:hypothetical protein